MTMMFASAVEVINTGALSGRTAFDVGLFMPAVFLCGGLISVGGFILGFGVSRMLERFRSV